MAPKIKLKVAARSIAPVNNEPLPSDLPQRDSLREGSSSGLSSLADLSAFGTSNDDEEPAEPIGQRIENDVQPDQDSSDSDLSSLSDQSAIIISDDEQERVEPIGQRIQIGFQTGSGSSDSDLSDLSDLDSADEEERAERTENDPEPGNVTHNSDSDSSSLVISDDEEQSAKPVGQQQTPQRIENQPEPAKDVSDSVLSDLNSITLSDGEEERAEPIREDTPQHIETEPQPHKADSDSSELSDLNSITFSDEEERAEPTRREETAQHVENEPELAKDSSKPKTGFTRIRLITREQRLAREAEERRRKKTEKQRLYRAEKRRLKEMSSVEKIQSTEKMSTEKMPSTALPTGEAEEEETPEVPRPTYKSWKKKYRKMRVEFDKVMAESDELHRQYEEGKRTLLRLKIENSQILDMLLDMNNDPHIPASLRYDLSEDVAPFDKKISLLDEDDVPNDEELKDMDPKVAATWAEIRGKLAAKKAKADALKTCTRSLKQLAESVPYHSILTEEGRKHLDPQLLEDLLGQENAEGYLTLEELERYHDEIDAELGQLDEPNSLTAAKNTAASGSTVDPALTQNPNSAYNWLRKHEPKIFLQDGEGNVEKSASKPGALRGAGKRGQPVAQPRAAEQVEFVEEDGIGYEAGAGLGSAKGKRKQRLEDTSYRPKGGSSRGKDKKKGSSGESAASSSKKSGKKGGGSGSGSAPIAPKEEEDAEMADLLAAADAENGVDAPGFFDRPRE